MRHYKLTYTSCELHSLRNRKRHVVKYLQWKIETPVNPILEARTNELDGLLPAMHFEIA